MSDQPKKKVSVKREKTICDHHAVLVAYKKKLRDSFLQAGKYAPDIKKSTIYSEVADETHYSAESVKRIVISSLKHQDPNDQKSIDGTNA